LGGSGDIADDDCRGADDAGDGPREPRRDTAVCGYGVANLGATVVHLTGTETITGTKQFAVSPRLPAPVGANDATNKGYVDAPVSNVGSGAYVAIAGGTMTGH